MPITELNMKDHGFYGLRVLVQSCSQKRLKYLSFKGKTKKEVKSLYAEARALNAEWELQRDLEKLNHKLTNTHWRTSKPGGLGITGLTLYYSTSRGRTSHTVGLRVTYKRDIKSFSFSAHGVDKAWRLSVSDYLRKRSLPNKYRAKINKLKPSEKQIEEYIRHLRKKGLPANMPDW